MKVSDFSIRHPVIIGMLFIVLLVFGLIALMGLRQDLTADVNLPTVVVITSWPGAGPEEIESDITEPIEEELATLSGISSMESDSGDGLSVVTMEFDYAIDLDLKMSDIRERLTVAGQQLPDGITGPPTLLKMSSDLLPIYTVVVSSPMDEAELGRFVRDEVGPALSRIPGVAQANVRGDREEIVKIILDVGLMDAKGVSVSQVLEVLQVTNTSLPGGSVSFRGNTLMLKTSGDFSSLDEIGRTVVASRGASLIRLGDIALVETGFRDAERYVVEEGKSLVLIDLLKQSGGDSVEIIKRAKATLDSISRERNGIVTFRTVNDFSEDIELAIGSVRSSAFTGALLAVLVLLLFLHNIRTTLIISISIPASVLLSFAALYLKGQSLNLMTLGALTLAVGMIVDSSIVVLENIHRHFDRGMERSKAASLGAGEVGSAVVASTTTSLMVFVPLLFLEGFTGIILRDVSWTLTWALSASLLAAVVLIPWLASRLMKPPKLKEKSKILGGLSRMIEGWIHALTRSYRKSLSSVLRRPSVVFTVAVLLLVASVMAIDFLGFQFIPSTDMNEIQINLETPKGYSLEDTRVKALEVDQKVRELVPEIDTAIWYVGQEDSWGTSTSRNHCFVRVNLKPLKERSRRVHPIIRQLQRELPASIPDIDITVVNGGLDSMMAVATGGEGFRIELSASDTDLLVSAVRRVEEMMGQDPDVIKTGVNLDFDDRELVTELDLELMGDLGVAPREAALTGRVLFHGMDVGSYRGGEKSLDLFLTSNMAGEPLKKEEFNSIAIRAADGAQVPFSAFSETRDRPALSTIRHSNRMKSATVTGYLGGSSVRGVASRISGRLGADPLPPGVVWKVAGSTEQMTESFGDLLFAMAISIFLVYTVMVIQFERFIQPLIVMASVPFVVIGVVASLSAYRSTLNIVSLMGMIALAGIVVNNAIVLIDYINLLRRRDGLSLARAVIAGSASRLRPILMTTLTTVIGIIPMALGIGEGAEIYAPLGQAISGGLATSTLVTLFLVPTLYFVVEARVARMKVWLKEGS